MVFGNRNTGCIKNKKTTNCIIHLTALILSQINMRKLEQINFVHTVLSNEYKTLCSYPTLTKISRDISKIARDHVIFTSDHVNITFKYVSFCNI